MLRTGVCRESAKSLRQHKLRVSAVVKTGLMGPLHTYLSRLVLILCLCVYGPPMMAMAHGDGVLVEICADGVVTTVRVDASGMPLDTRDSCDDCLACCHAPQVVTPVPATADQPLALCSDAAHAVSLRAHFIQTPDIRPLPRGPPAATDLQSILPGVILSDRDDMRGTGRSDLKDAVA